MSSFPENFNPENKSGSDRWIVIARSLWPLLVECWLFAVLAGFLVIRVFGSHTARSILSGIQRHYFP